MSWFELHVLFETTLYTRIPTTGISPGEKVAFQVSLFQLKTFSCAPREDEVLVFTFNASIRLLMIRSEAASGCPVRLKWDTWTADGLGQQYDRVLGTPTMVGKVDPLLVGSIVRFGRLFAEDDSLRPMWSQISIRDGVAHIRGPYTSNRMAQVKSSKLGGLQISIKYKYLSLLEDLLGHFELSETNLYDTKNHHVFHDGVTCLAFEKGGTEPPELSGPMWMRECRSRIFVTRSGFLNVLENLKSAPLHDLGREFSGVLRVDSGGPGTQLALQARTEETRSLGTAAIACSRVPPEGGSINLAPYKRIVSFKTLHDVLSHFESPDVVIEEMQEGHLRIQEEMPDFHAICWISAAPVLPIEKKPARPGLAKRRR